MSSVIQNPPREPGLRDLQAPTSDSLAHHSLLGAWRLELCSDGLGPRPGEETTWAVIACVTWGCPISLRASVSHKSMKRVDLMAWGPFGHCSVGCRNCPEEQDQGWRGQRRPHSLLSSSQWPFWELQGPPSPTLSSRSRGSGADLHNGFLGTVL